MMKTNMFQRSSRISDTGVFGAMTPADAFAGRIVVTDGVVKGLTYKISSHCEDKLSSNRSVLAFECDSCGFSVTTI
jgi:hypothetical protein